MSGHGKGSRKRKRQREASRQSEGAIAKETGGVSEPTKLVPEQSKVKVDKKLVAMTAATRREKFNELLGLIGFAGTVASWGWSVIAPESSVWFGSLLLFTAVASISLAVFRMLEPRKLLAATSALLLLCSFVAVDWLLLIKPQRGKPFKELLASGYHLTDECGNHPAREPMPTWMRDESKAWQAQVQQLVMEKLDPKDLQIWRGAVVMGLVTDENMTAYQCMWLSEKVAALETIINAHYDPGLRHQEYQGPLYWLESIDGKVDVSEAFKNGAARFTIHEKPSGNSAVEIQGKVH
jgi:hypothetical protein